MAYFLPARSHIKDADLATELDGIMVVRKRDDDTCFIRLVGRNRSLDLVLAPSGDDSLIAFTELHPALDSGWDVIFNVNGFCGCCFADVGIFVRQIGLDQWTLTRTSSECQLHGYRSWAYSTFARIMSGDVFHLENDMYPALLSSLWQKLFPNGRDLRESTSSCPGMDDKMVTTREAEFEVFSIWRRRAVPQVGSDAMEDDRFLARMKAVILKNRIMQILPGSNTVTF